MNPFTLSIETTVGNCHQYGFHLGIDEKLADRSPRKNSMRDASMICQSFLLASCALVGCSTGTMAIGEAATINPSSQVRDAGRGNSEQRSHVHESTLFLARPQPHGQVQLAATGLREKSHCARMKFPA